MDEALQVMLRISGADHPQRRSANDVLDDVRQWS